MASKTPSAPQAGAAAGPPAPASAPSGSTQTQLPFITVDTTTGQFQVHDEAVERLVELGTRFASAGTTAVQSVIGALKAAVAGATEPADLVSIPDVKEAVWLSVPRESEADFYDKVSPKWTAALKLPTGRSMLLDLRAETFVFRPLEVDDYHTGFIQLPVPAELKRAIDAFPLEALRGIGCHARHKDGTTVCEWSEAQTRALDAWADLMPDPVGMKEFLRWDSNSYNGIGVMADYYRCMGLGLVGDYEYSVMVAPMGPVDRDGRYATSSAKSMKASLRAVVVPEDSGYVQKTMLSVFAESKDPDGPRVGQTVFWLGTAEV